MIKTKKNAAFEMLFRWYNRRLLREHFYRLHLAGLEHVQQLDRIQPIIVFANHSCWWDGLIEYYLAKEVLDADIHLMMEEKQMVRYRFFRWIGAFSVNRDSARDAVQSMRYAASLFDTPNRFLWIYPQGTMKPNEVRPLDFYPGVARIAEMVGRKVQFLPLVHRYEFLMQQRPEAFTLIGEPKVINDVSDYKRLTGELEDVLAKLLDTLRSKIAREEFEGFQTILNGASSTNEKYDEVRMKR